VEAVVRRVLNEGTARGQASWATTSKAVLASIQQLTNKVDALAAKVEGSQ
jgi:hypothetical protein